MSTAGATGTGTSGMDAHAGPAERSPAAHRLVLRLGMLPTPTPAEPSLVTAPTAGDLAPSAELSKLLRSLDSGRREAMIELHRGGECFGKWPFTARDLNVSMDPEALANLQEHAGGWLPASRALVARSAQSLSSRFPEVVTVNLLDTLREHLSPDPSLPLVISKALREALDMLAPGRKLVWLELAEPLGFLPYLPWEPMLRRAVGVPILRHARKPLRGFDRRPSLDLVLVCSASEAHTTVAAASVVATCRQVLAAWPAGRRCVIHLFADFLHRPGIERALADSDLPSANPARAGGERGVHLHAFPESPAAERLAAEPHDRTPSIWERPWAAWIQAGLQGRAADVVHFIGGARFFSGQPALEVSAVPWRPPEPVERKMRWLTPWRDDSRLDLRLVDAALACDFATGLGAWGLIFGAPDGGSLRAQRLLVHQISALFPGVFAVHDLGRDSAAEACAALYAFLAEGPETPGERAIPDRPELVLQCHPALIEGLDRRRVEVAFGREFSLASQALAAELGRFEWAPAWAVSIQRQIEHTASTSLAEAPSSERDQAARRGIGAALTETMRHVVAQLRKEARE